MPIALHSAGADMSEGDVDVMRVHTIVAMYAICVLCWQFMMGMSSM